MLCISHGAAESPKKECPKGKLHSAVTVVLTVKGFSVRSVCSVVLLVKGRNRTALSSTNDAAEPVTPSEATERIMNCLSALPLLRASASLENYEL